MSDSEEPKHTSSEESTTSEEEDENGKEWTEDIEKTFLKTLSSLKSKDPKIYDENVKFFDKEIGTSINSKSAVERRKNQPLYLRDYERKIILEKNGVLTDEDSDDETINNRKNERSQSPSYVEEQRIIKEGFKHFLNSDNETSDSETDCAGFLKTKVKTTEEKTKEDEEYVEWLKGQKSKLSDKETETQLKYLRDYWTDPKLNEGEQFLRDYILNKRYQEPNTTPSIENEVSFSEEERILDECEEYEQMYNFRFEEPDKNFIKTYPRNIETSLRRKDDSRKKKREERKKRKEEQLQQKHLEIKKLKKQKKEELLERIKKLKELTGNSELGFDDKDLQNDFSPDEYDKKMGQLFNEEFYANVDDDTKPVFSDSDIEYGDNEDDYVDDENFNENNNLDEYSENLINTEDELTAENPNFIMDCDYDPQEEKESKFKKQTRSSGRKGHKKTKFAQVIEREKPVFNPADKSFQQYVDEYYGLEFEDIIGDMPCRYNYRKVMPNSFGLTVEEILAADDKELNKWCSMQKIIALRPEQNEKFDLKVYSRRGQNLDLKKKFLPSLFKGENNEESKSSDINNEVNSPKKKKKKKRKSKAKVCIPESNEAKNSVAEGNIVHSINGKHEDNDRKSKKRKADSDINRVIKKPSLNVSSQKKNIAQMKKLTFDEKLRKKKFNLHNSEGKNSEQTNISDERLKAYGINPKRFKNKLKYGQNKN